MGAQQQAELAKRQLEVEEQQMATERTLESERYKLRHNLKSYYEELQRQRSAAEHAHMLQQRKAELDVDGNMSENAMDLYRLKRTAEIYEKLPLRSSRSIILW